MKYSKRHFEDIAALINSCGHPSLDTHFLTKEQVSYVAELFARHFSVHNPRFNIDKFIVAATKN